MDDGTFKVGEIALFQKLRGSFAHLNGEECEVVETMKPRALIDLHGNTRVGITYKVDYKGLACAVPPQKLAKKPKPNSDHVEKYEMAEA